MKIRPHANLFRVGRPIQDPDDFVGRVDVLKKISSAMLSLQNVSLCSEQSMGKTSLLLYLAHPDSSEVIGLPGTHVPAYLNFQNLATASVGSVWQAMADAIVEQIEKRHPDLEADVKRFRDTIAEFLAPSKEVALFGTGLGRALAHLDDSGIKIHLLFDEFDQTSRNPNLGDSFYDALRSLPTRAENVSYVIATRTGLAALQPTYDKVSSPFFNIFTTISLTPFSKDEVRRLIFDYFARAKLDFSLAQKLYDESAFLHDVTGYHPFFMQTLCYHLCTRLDTPDWPQGQAQQEALRAFEKDAKPRFEYYWQVSSKEEQNLIRRLTTKQPIDWNQDANQSWIEELKNRCLIVPSESGWQLFSSAFARWVELKQADEPENSSGVSVMKGSTPQPKHENFDIIVTKQADNTYTIRAEYSRGGAVSIMGRIFPLDSPKFQDLFGALATLTGDRNQAEAAGALMREYLFPPDIWTLFVRSWDDAKKDGKYLRLRLRIKPPEINMLPWEYCFDKDHGFFALRRGTPLIRYIDRPFIPVDTKPHGSTEVLLATASPSGWGTLAVEAEAAQIRDELQELNDIEVNVLRHVTWDSLQVRLKTFKPHVLHFIGHGEFDIDSGQGKLVLENESGASHMIRAKQFANQLWDSGVKVVVLNACKTATHSPNNAFMGIAPALVRAEIPAVIAMQFAIPDETARRFARQLYRYLALGEPLDRAITEARINISGYDDVFWAIPVLFMRARDGVVW